MDRFFVFTILLCVFWMMTRWSSEPSHGPGVLIKAEPQQSNYRQTKPALPMKGWLVEPVADYVIQARVLEAADYDSYPIDELVPRDLLLGWGPMSDSAVVEKLELNISNRYATWRWWGQPPIPGSSISQHASNHHLVPANDHVREQLGAVRTGHLVTLRGELVNIRKSSSSQPDFVSSLTRHDTGPGACEVMLVKSLVVR
jgi:hypothetical protein